MLLGAVSKCAKTLDYEQEQGREHNMQFSIGMLINFQHFDGTTRLYISYTCPYAQRTWIARNYEGLQDKIKLVAINLNKRPAWYKEKIYPRNKVPALEHNNEVKGESLDLLKYIDSDFDGPSLLTSDPAKQQFAEELLAYSDQFISVMFIALPSMGGVGDEAAAAFDNIEDALSKFDDGPFFLGQFSLEVNKIDAYSQTQLDPQIA